MSFMQRIQLLIKHLDWTQKRLADTADIDEATISRWAKSGKVPTRKSLTKIANATGCSVEWLKSCQGEMMKSLVGKAADAAIDPLNEAAGGSVEVYRKNIISSDFKISDMVNATIRILESDTVYKTALASNIRAFDNAVIQEADVDDLKGKIDILIQTQFAMKDEMAEMRREIVSDKQKFKKRDEQANS